MIPPRKNIKKLNRMKDFGSDRSAFMRFDKNERTLAFPEEIYQSMLSTISNDNLTMYPDQNPLYSSLSEFLSINQNHILLTAGSDAAIKSIYETYVEPGDKVVYLWPTYAMIDVYAEMFEAEKVKVGYSPELELDFTSLLEKIDSDARVVFIANPNQPTGTILLDDQINQLIQRTQETNTLLVFDEAYQPFSGQESCIRYVQQYPHVLVVQTFSKAIGLASARLGYIITQPINIQWLYKVKSYADINLLAIKIGKYLLDNYWIVEDYIQSVKTSKNLLESELKTRGIQTIKGYANFVHLKFPIGYDLELIAESMKDKGYLIRTTGSGLPAVLEGCIRITVGPAEQMQKFLTDFKSIINDIKET